MNTDHSALAFVDLETTGGSATKDRITEIGIVLVDSQGVHEWTQLINPQTRIPDFIAQITGITNAMVQDAPLFQDVATEVEALLHGRLFIAHNARFDYGFLKNEFKRVGREFRPNILCTVKLSRSLYPEYRQHNLDSLITRHQLCANNRHRALADAQLIFQFWNTAQRQFSQEILSSTVQTLVNRSSLPAHLDPLLIHDLPEGPGVYLFFGENDMPLYIGKSINIKQRILSHFAADHSHNKEMSLSRQLRRIEWIETAGEIGALLTEAKLIKTLLPIHNQRLRRKNALCTWQLQQTQEQLRPVLTWADSLNFGTQDNLYGLYTSQRDAQKALRNLADRHQLCAAVMGLEKIAPGKPCFAFQLKKCKGACMGLEPPLAHATRLLIAMQKMQLLAWPYAQPVGIKEGEDLHIIDHWCYLGTAKTETDIYVILASGRPAFDRDTYLVLHKAFKKAKVLSLAQYL